MKERIEKNIQSYLFSTRTNFQSDNVFDVFLFKFLLCLLTTMWCLIMYRFSVHSLAIFWVCLLLVGPRKESVIFCVVRRDYSIHRMRKRGAGLSSIACGSTRGVKGVARCKFHLKIENVNMSQFTVFEIKPALDCQRLSQSNKLLFQEFQFVGFVRKSHFGNWRPGFDSWCVQTHRLFELLICSCQESNPGPSGFQIVRSANGTTRAHEEGDALSFWIFFVFVWKSKKQNACGEW